MLVYDTEWAIILDRHVAFLFEYLFVLTCDFSHYHRLRLRHVGLSHTDADAGPAVAVGTRINIAVPEIDPLLAVPKTSKLKIVFF